MTQQHDHRSTRVWRRAVIAVAAMTGIVATHGAVAGAEAREGPDRSAPIWEQVAERQELRRIVALMPAGWPATEVMSDEADEPLGDVAQRASWRRTVAIMPADWPATQAMLAELAR